MHPSSFARCVMLAIGVILMSACQPVMPEATSPPAAAPTAVQQEESAGEVDEQRYTSMAGFELSLPPGWAILDDPNGVMFIASSEALLAAEDFLPVSDGVLMLLLNMSQDAVPPLPLPELLNMFIDVRALPAQATEGPEETTIGGQAAVWQAGAGEADGTAFIYLAAAIASDTRLGRAIAIMPQAREAELRPLVEGLIDSIVVGEPTPEQLDLSNVEGEISPGETVSAELQPDATMIWRLSGTAGQMLIISAAPASNLDVVLRFVDAAGTSMFAVDIADSEGDGGTERRLATLPADGDYYVILRGFTGSSGSIDIMVSETAIAAPVESADDLIGTWGSSSAYYRFEDDGTFRMAFDATSLADSPAYLGQYQVEDGVITLGRNEAAGFCAEADGLYQAILLSGGELSFTPVEDMCPPRANGLNGIVLPPAQD